MAIFVVDEPVEIVLARNPAILQLRSDVTPAVGARALMAIPALSDRFATGETLSVTYTEPDATTETVIFTAVASPADDDKIPDASWAGTNAAYWVAVAQAVAKHPRIAPFFTSEIVTISGSSYLQVKAIDAVSTWEVDMSNDPGYTVTQEASEPDSTPDNYRVLVEVFFEKSYRSGNYERVAQLEGFPAPDTGFMYFDLSNILEAQCRANRPEPLVPQFDTSTLAIADNLRRYYLRYTEESGTPATTAEWQYGNLKYAMDGGISQSLFAEAGYAGYLDGLDADNALLSWMPDGRSMGENQPEYLPWYNHTGETKEIVLQRIQYNVDTGVAAGTAYLYEGAAVPVRQYETLLIPVGPALMSISGSNIYKYTVRVVDAASDYEGSAPEYLSQPRRYYIDRKYTESQRYIEYVNGFGAPECWRCTGEWAKKLSVKRDTADVALAPGYNALASETLQYARQSETPLTYRTGYLRKGEAEVLQELLMAGQVYDVGEDGYIPLRLTGTSFAVTSTRENLHAYSIEAVPRLDMRNFSKRTVTSGTADAWQETNDDAWFDAITIPWGMP